MMSISPVKVLFVEASREFGGAQGILVDLLKALRSEFHIVEPIVVCAQNSLVAQKCRALSIKTYELPIASLLDPLTVVKNYNRIRQTIHQEKPRVVVGNDFGGHFYSAPVARLMNIPNVWWIHGVALPQVSRTWILQWVTSKLQATTLITNSQWTRLKLHERLNISADVIYYGIDLHRFGQSQEHRGSIRDEFRVDPDALVISSVGRLIGMKGHHIFLQACAIALRAIPTTRIFVVGGKFGNSETTYLEELKQLAVELGIADRVIFTGFRDDVHKFMSATDVFVHATTLHEPFGLTIVEAMALSTPVIATRTGGPEEIVLHSETGYLVEPNNAEEMARYIELLAKDHELRTRMGRAGAKRARELYSLSRLAEDFERILLEHVHTL